MTGLTGRTPKALTDSKQLTPFMNGTPTSLVRYISMELDHREGGNVTVQGRIRVGQTWGAAARDESRAQPPRVGAAAKDESWAQPPRKMVLEDSIWFFVPFVFVIG